MAINWIECQPGVIVPAHMGCDRFPPFADFDIEQTATQAANAITNVVELGDTFKLPPWAWGAWYAAQKRDLPLKIDAGLQRQIADRLYESKRYIALVPAWRRWMVEILTEIDDVEDQLSTVLWMVELLGKKIPPLRNVDLSIGKELNALLQKAENVLAAGTVNRSSKAQFIERKRELANKRRAARGTWAKLFLWFRENYTRLLEAGQATGTWFDVGVILGPIMGFISQQYWLVLSSTVDNFLIAADAVLPGYRDSFYTKAEEYWEYIETTTLEALEPIELAGAGLVRTAEKRGLTITPIGAFATPTFTGPFEPPRILVEPDAVIAGADQLTAEERRDLLFEFDSPAAPGLSLPWWELPKLLQSPDQTDWRSIDNAPPEIFGEGIEFT